MNHEIGELIDECIHLQNEIGLLSPIMLSYFSPKAFKDMVSGESSASKKSQYRARWEQISGLDKMRNFYTLQLKALHQNFSDLAKQIETSRLRIEEFQSLLPEDQFSWLVSHQREIKNYLQKIE
jgi:hypothetical protein